MINTIIFDIGQVLAWFRWKEYIKDFGWSEEINEAVSRATVLSSNIWKEFDRGVLTYEELFERSYQVEPNYREQIKIFYNNMEQLVFEYDYSEMLIKKLKEKGFKVYLLSNYSKIPFEYAQKNFKFLKYVDGGIISYQVKHIKPEPEIYKCLIDKYNIIPNQSVFFDDVQENLDGAAKFGINTIKVTKKEDIFDGLKNLIDFEI